MSNHEIGPHTRGESLFVEDLPDPQGLLHAAVLASPIPHAKIVRLDTTPAAEFDGVVAVLTAADIPGENQIGGIVHDEPLLAEGVVRPARRGPAGTSRSRRARLPSRDQLALDLGR